MPREHKWVSLPTEPGEWVQRDESYDGDISLSIIQVVRADGKLKQYRYGNTYDIYPSSSYGDGGTDYCRLILPDGG